jgi:hypothetical protein
MPNITFNNIITFFLIQVSTHDIPLHIYKLCFFQASKHKYSMKSCNVRFCIYIINWGEGGGEESEQIVLKD